MNRSEQRPKLGDVAAVLRGLDGGDVNKAMRRELVAAWCKMALPVPNEPEKHAPPAANAANELSSTMAPRIRETLRHLLIGDSEKQIANKLGISQHTVHVYVKRLYRHYDVNSRGELLARFVSTD
ncbi:MAG TPA: helix-turn-helix transcriptional regulator [Tepidisphaeraceae bacterium]|jgi:DNA-binding CsgD family transcriptional regulator|nr:helix-turn-helix transcriptional regulator [Tepidisphaeraceae bacterium]